ncbi:MAG: DNA repair and recombination protein RadB [Thermoplasmata archaeon]
MEEVKVDETLARTKCGISCIDDLMGGGIESGIITELYGEGGSGKTNLSMIFSCSVMNSGMKVIYIDSEGFSSERFLNICSSDLKKFKLYRVFSLDDQEVAIMKAAKIIEKDENYGMLIIDSFTEFFRLERSDDFQSRISEIQKQLSIISSIAARRKIPVLITNQIYQDIENKNLIPFGGFAVDHIMKAIYSMEKLKNGRRRISVIKHRSIKDGMSTDFTITDSGIECGGVSNGNGHI